MRLIDADALTAKWQNVLDEKSNEKDTVAYLTFELFIDRLKEEPTIDHESLRPQGEWVKHSGIHGFVYCSNCRDVYLDSEWLADGKWTFCPNCGAKMNAYISENIKR